jgi:hypothetical protein
MALLQALLALISKSAGKILNALFGWAVRALFGQTTAREQTFLSVVVAAAVAWPVLLVGIAAPKIAALLLAFVPIPHAVPSWAVRIVWVALALIIPFAVGIAVAKKSPVKSPAKAPASDSNDAPDSKDMRKESRLLTVLRGFPITVGLAAAFIVMFVSVPVMRLGAILRRRKSADIPLVTDEAAYHQVADIICGVLNRHGFALRPAAPGWWVAAPIRILTWLGGDAFRSYVPSQLEHFVSPDLELSLYPSGLLVRGKAQSVTWAHGLIAESVVHTEGLQTVDPKAQALEKRIRRVWKTYDTAPAQIVGSENLVQALEQLSGDLARLQVDFDDWQVLYRQILQVGRAIHGQRQLMDLEATKAQRKAQMEAQSGAGRSVGTTKASLTIRATG